MMMDFKDGVQQVSNSQRNSLRFGKDFYKKNQGWSSTGDLIGTKFFEIFFSVATTQQKIIFSFQIKGRIQSNQVRQRRRELGKQDQ